MNWLLIVVVLVLALCILQGYRKGLLGMLYSIVSWGAMFALVSWSAPHLNTFIKEQTPVSQNIEGYCEKIIRQKAQQIQGQTGTAADDDVRAEAIDRLAGLGIKLPDSALKNISEKTMDAAAELADSSGIYGQAAKSMSDFIVSGFSFFAALAAAMLLIHFISRILKTVSKVPVIRGVDRYLGSVIGAVYGFMIIWIAFFIVALCSTTEIGTKLTAFIYESPFLIYLYENNLIVTIMILLL